MSCGGLMLTTMLLGEFNAHDENDVGVLRGVIGQHGNAK